MLEMALGNFVMTFGDEYDNSVTNCCVLLPTVHFLLTLLKISLNNGEKSPFVTGDLTKHARAHNRTMIELFG